MSVEPLVAGIDPSLTGIGVALSDGTCFRVGRTGITKLPLARRIEAVDLLVFEILRKVAGADMYVIETPAHSRASGGSLERHALWWLIVHALWAEGLPVAEVPIQARMRYATGKGAATKEAVVDAVARRLPQFVTEGDNNLADAAIFAAMGSDHLGFPLAVFPAAHRKALESVDWPSCPPWDEGR